MSKDRAKVLYLAWLARAQPLVYQRVVALANKSLLERRLAGLDHLNGWPDTLINAAIAVGGTLMAKKQADQAASLQKKQQAADLQLTLLQVNTQRAQAGLAPIDANGNLIPVKMLPIPATLNTSAVQSTLASGGAPNYMLWAAGAIAALAGVFLVTRGR